MWQGEVAFPRKILGVSKLKNPKHEFLQSGLLKKKNKTHDDVFKVILGLILLQIPYRLSFLIFLVMTSAFLL